MLDVYVQKKKKIKNLKMPKLANSKSTIFWNRKFFFHQYYISTSGSVRTCDPKIVPGPNMATMITLIIWGPLS